MRIQDVQTQKVYSLIKTRKPKMSEHRGRTWDTDRIVLDGEIVWVWRDFTWGSYNYFLFQCEWYKFTVDATDFAGKQGFVLLGVTKEGKR